MTDFENLATAMGELDEDTVKEILEAIDTPEAANQAMEACQKGMDTVGKLFEEGEYFVGDLIYAGELMTDAVEVLKPYLASSEDSGSKTRMILCTVKDDLHDIGKNIVRSMLEANGFDVLDLGRRHQDCGPVRCPYPGAGFHEGNGGSNPLRRPGLQDNHRWRSGICRSLQKHRC